MLHCRLFVPLLSASGLLCACAFAKKKKEKLTHAMVFERRKIDSSALLFAPLIPILLNVGAFFFLLATLADANVMAIV